MPCPATDQAMSVRCPKRDTRSGYAPTGVPRRLEWEALMRTGFPQEGAQDGTVQRAERYESGAGEGAAGGRTGTGEGAGGRGPGEVAAALAGRPALDGGRRAGSLDGVGHAVRRRAAA